MGGEKGGDGMIGYTFWMEHKDFFYVTSQKNVTEQLVNSIMEKANLPGRFHDIRSRLRKAECNVITLPNGRAYYEIHGKGFGGRGSFVGDGKTVIINCIKH